MSTGTRFNCQLFFFSVLPVLSPVHRGVRRGRSHRHRSGKLLPAPHPPPFSPPLHRLYEQHQMLLFSFLCGRCNKTRDDYRLDSPQLYFHLLFTICLAFVLQWVGPVWGCYFSFKKIFLVILYIIISLYLYIIIIISLYYKNSDFKTVIF